MKLHFDACVAQQIARAFRVLEQGRRDLVISIHEEEFPEGAKDVEWLPEIKPRGVTAILTADDRIRRNRDERRLWLESRTTLYVLSNTFASSRGWNQVTELVHWWPALLLHMKTAEPCTIWSLPWRDKKPTQLTIPPDRPEQGNKKGA